MFENIYSNAENAGVGGFGGVSQAHVDDLKKALAAGHDVNNPGAQPGNGFPLRVESLDAVMKNLAYSMDEIKIFQSIGKIPATNTIEEYNRLLSYDSNGQNGSFYGGWFNEGGLPDEENSTYERTGVLMKFIGQVRRVTHVADTIKSAHGDVVAQQTSEGTMSLLRSLEWCTIFGDSTLVSQQFDGLRKNIVDFAPENVIDLRGAAPSDDVVNDALEKIRRSNGRGTDLYFATGPFSDLAKKVYDRQRYNPGSAGDTLGASVKYFQGQHGKINFHDHLFIQEGGLAGSGVGPSDKRPVTPTISVDPAAGANPASLFIAADAGSYIYRVVAGNANGLSSAVNSAAVVVAAGDAVTFSILDGGRATYYEIYRTAVGAAVGTARLMTRVRRTAATTVVTDLNGALPGTSDGFLLQQNSQSFEWAQLLGMTRVPLAVVDTSIRWAQVCYGGLKVYAPGRNIVFTNVGRAPGAVS